MFGLVSCRRKSRHILLSALTFTTASVCSTQIANCAKIKVKDIKGIFFNAKNSEITIVVKDAFDNLEKTSWNLGTYQIKISKNTPNSVNTIAIDRDVWNYFIKGNQSVGDAIKYLDNISK